MRLLVIDHMTWIRMMCHSWTLAGAELTSFLIPTVTLAHQPAAKRQVAAALRARLAQDDHGVIVDVDGAGVLPLDPGFQTWTVTATNRPWLVWWWDDPYTVAKAHLGNPSDMAGWVAALRRPNVIHIFWDAVLAREYSDWFGKPAYYVPTGTHTGFYHPDAAPASRPFAPADVSFLGGYYAEHDAAADPEVEGLAAARLANTAATFLELTATVRARYPRFLAAVEAARHSPACAFDAELIACKERVEWIVGRARRNRVLDRIAERIPAYRFIGGGWPERFRMDLRKIDRPEELVACYRQTRLNLALGSARTFTGTAMRCYEIMAAGAALAIQGRPDFDPDGRLRDQVYVSFDTVDELVGLLDAYRERPKALEALGANARQFAVERCSWNHRLVDLLRLAAGTVPETRPS